MAHPARQVDMEERFCELVKGLGCTCVTISHRPALMAFHDLVLALDGEGGWSLHQGARAAPAGGAALLACARPPNFMGSRRWDGRSAAAGVCARAACAGSAALLACALHRQPCLWTPGLCTT